MDRPPESDVGTYIEMDDVKGKMKAGLKLVSDYSEISNLHGKSHSEFVDYVFY